MIEILESEPVGYAIKVQLEKAEEKTKGGLFIPQAAQERQNIYIKHGTVVALGPEVNDPDKFKTPRCALGDIVLFRTDVGYKIIEDQRDYVFLTEDDIVAKVTKHREREGI